MKSITKIIKILDVVVALLVFITVSFAAVQTSLASEEPAENRDTSSTGKYSKFFDEKTRWCDALVITCNDFRFTSATQEFVNERLGLKGNYNFKQILQNRKLINLLYKGVFNGKK